MSNRIYDDGYYNEECKIRYLSRFDQATQAPFQRILRRAKDLETPFQKDLYNFNTLEIEQLVKYLSPKTTDSSYLALSVIQLYIRWAIAEDLRSNNINPLDSLMSREYSKRLIDKSAEIFFTADEINKITNSLFNYQDKAVVQAIFEGINVSELLNLTRDSILDQDHTLYLVDDNGSARVLKISAELRTIMIAACEEKTYYKKNGNVSEKIRNTDKLKLVVSPYVIRHTNTNVKTEKAARHTVSRRLKMIAELFHKPYFNPSNIRNSGMLHEAMKRYQASQGKGLAQQDYYDICDQFNTANNGRYSYTNLKRSFLNEENIKALYGSSGIFAAAR